MIDLSALNLDEYPPKSRLTANDRGDMNHLTCNNSRFSDFSAGDHMTGQLYRAGINDSATTALARFIMQPRRTSFPDSCAGEKKTL